MSMHGNLVIGFMLWLGILFIVDYLFLRLNTESIVFFTSFYIFAILFFFLGVRKIKVNKWDSILFFLAFIIFLISLKYGLGEKLGDNSYLTSMVTMNVNGLHMNTTEFSSGFKVYQNAIGPYKAYLTWYHFYSAIIFAQQRIFEFLNINFIPSYLVYIWTGNILFYLLSIVLYKSILNVMKVKQRWVIIASIVFYFYWNTIYYHLVLGHYGTNFISIFVAGFWYLLYSTETMSRKNIWMYILSIYAIIAMGNVGLTISAFIVFSLSVYEIVMKKEDIFLFIPFLLLPIFHWIYILGDVIPTIWLIPFIIIVSALSWFIHFIKPLKEFIFKYILYILAVSLVFWYGIVYFKSNNYWVLFKDFFAVKSNFDRLQDYFSVSNLFDTMRNIAFYLALIGLFLNIKTRKIGWMVLILLIFFINPFVYPLLYPQLQWLYHRSYISIFNMFVIILGIYGLYFYLINLSSKIKYVFLLGWIILLIPSTYQQVTGYFHPIYEPSSDFNVIYKLDNNEIEVLDKLRQIVDLEHYENAKVISQIYATTMYVPDVYQMFFNVYDRRGYDVNIPEESFNDLYRIFYTPVFAGDDGLRFNAPVSLTCDLLIANQIDFVIYKKDLSVFDSKSNNWIPLYWYARNCSEKVIENNQYILYRFYWEHN